MFNNPIFSYIGFAVGIVAVAFGVLKPDWADYAWTLAGIFGFGSIALLRQFVDSKGWKTYAVFLVVCAAAVAQIAGFISPEVFQSLLVAFAPITGITMQQALAKSSASIPKVNGG